jgi:iron complex transport system substrate-binding protein
MEINSMKRLLIIFTIMLAGITGTAIAQDSDATTCDDTFRAIEHAAGTTCVPDDPQRVVVLHPVFMIDNVYALGIEPIGTAIYTNRYAVAPYLEDLGYFDPDATTSLGNLVEPNLELMLELEPDLILGLPVHDFELLSDIAPTVIFDYDQSQWAEFLLDMGDVLNRQGEALALLNEYEDRVQVVREAIGNPANIDVSVVRVRPGSLRLYVNNSFAGSVLSDVVLDRPAPQDTVNADSPYIEISIEELDRADGDYVFVWGAIEGTDERLSELQASPLWNTLEAVQNDRVYYVDEPAWFAPGIIGTHLLLDDLLTIIAGVDPAEVAPNPFRE